MEKIYRDKDPINKIGHDGPGRVRKEHAGSGAPAKYQGIGNERKVNPRVDQEGGSRAEYAGTRGEIGPGHSHLSHATKELEAQHPHHHSVGGVHHTTEHLRHVPMHGMKTGHRHENSAHMEPGRSHAHPDHNYRDLK